MSDGSATKSKHTGIGRGEPAVDLNGTRYTDIEGSAADKNISIQYVDPSFNPLSQHGIALTTTQAHVLHVKVGHAVVIHDNWTNRDVQAIYYDSAGRKGDLHHFEVSPALADTLHLKYRNKRGRIIDSIVGSERMRGRFDIRRLPQR